MVWSPSGTTLSSRHECPLSQLSSRLHLTLDLPRKSSNNKQTNIQDTVMAYTIHRLHGIPVMEAMKMEYIQAGEGFEPTFLTTQCQVS